MSTDEYVPDEHDLEVAWIEFEASADDINVASAEFDRFLARVRREAKAEAWQEGVNFALPGKETYWISKHNPHRATESGDSDEHR